MTTIKRKPLEPLKATASLHPPSVKTYRGGVQTNGRKSTGSQDEGPVSFPNRSPRFSKVSPRRSSLITRQTPNGPTGLTTGFTKDFLNMRESFHGSTSLNRMTPEELDSRRNTIGRHVSHGQIPDQSGPWYSPMTVLNEHVSVGKSDSPYRSRGSSVDQDQKSTPKIVQQNSISIDRKDSESNKIQKEMKLQDALSEKQTDNRASQEIDTWSGRVSGTIRSFRDTEINPYSKSHAFFNSKLYRNARQSMHASKSATSHKFSVKSRRQEEHAMQEMAWSRLIRYLVIHTHFDEKEVRALRNIYHRFADTGPEKDKGITRVQFREILTKHFGISSDAMLDQICRYFDSDHIGYISLTKWIRNLSTLLRGTFEEHTKYCFDIYDLKGEGAIGKNEILTLLQDCLIPVQGVEEDFTDMSNIREIAEMLLKKFDRDKVGSISLANFKYVVRRDPLNLQCLGQCLPDPMGVKSFLAMISDNYNRFTSSYHVPGMSNYDYERDRFNSKAESPYLMLGAVKKAKTAMNIMRNLFGKHVTVSSNHMKTASSKLLKGFDGSSNLPPSSKNSKTSDSGRDSTGTKVINIIEGNSEAQSMMNLSFPDRPLFAGKAHMNGHEEYEGLFIHEIIEKQLFEKNEHHHHHHHAHMHHVDSRTHQGLQHKGSGQHTDGGNGTGEGDHSMNPMLRRLSKKRRKKILKQQEEGPLDPRKQEELILLEMAPHQQIEYISKSTHFTTAEVRDFQKMFKTMTQVFGTPGDMNRALFRLFFIQVLGITDNVMLDQIFNYFDAGGEGSISVTEFLSNISIIIRGTLDEHIKFCYAVYDLNGDGGIGRAEVMALIRHTLNAPLDDDDDMNDSIRDMANMIMTQLDSEGTGQITMDSFREGVMRDPLSLQILGPCLPEERKIRALMALIIWDYKDFATNYSLPSYSSYPTERLRYNSNTERAARPSASTSVLKKFVGKPKSL
ncbi:unnamed protein product [Allacma fusca]|uniref:EF-hand domain-containing protein n=1 Tax=Allacma fusca TaxID=39272 RepID=A0A8J2PDK1_9HEXA|nr:unnamed protein product [Allacma fusca]